MLGHVGRVAKGGQNLIATDMKFLLDRFETFSRSHITYDGGHVEASAFEAWQLYRQSYREQ